MVGLVGLVGIVDISMFTSTNFYLLTNLLTLKTRFTLIKINLLEDLEHGRTKIF